MVYTSPAQSALHLQVDSLQQETEQLREEHERDRIQYENKVGVLKRQIQQLGDDQQAGESAQVDTLNQEIQSLQSQVRTSLVSVLS